jgi:ferredoxin
MVEVASSASFDQYEAMFDPAHARETAATQGRFNATDADGQAVQATLSINTLDCIGCGMCIAKCRQGVLRQVDGKAMIDLGKLNDCDLNAECVRTCPTQVVKLGLIPAANAADDLKHGAA